MPRKHFRLYLEKSLTAGASLPLEGSLHHYLSTVLRLQQGAEMLVFNAQDGEWTAVLRNVSKKALVLEIINQTRSPSLTLSLHLYFSPLKPGPTAFLIEKATELGVSDFHPVWTSRTQGRPLNDRRWTILMQEAAEQSERLTVPCLHEPLSFSQVLTQWSFCHYLWICDEQTTGLNLFRLLQELPRSARTLAFLVGPEGGFTDEERSLMSTHPAVQQISLGPQILRAETAALNALALVHSWDESLSTCL